ncbi:DUF6242 domain-containing protein [Chelatococcus sp.]|uniref:DUF6242 domain-containing protein n=1 Tax=Chelatococcus sp. TaxID=1953771 RepID=UPI001EBE9420|nr:DUF6242 domain-containing protein [Chelatococcus sp.]MBX3545597.1 hypothetical protein [Chelatococcus sp.]
MDPVTRALFMGAAKKKTAVIVAGGQNNYIVRSEDGVSWNTVFSSGSSSHYIQQIIWGGGMFVAVSYGGGIITSPDGINWTQRVSGLFYSVAYGNGVFIAMGEVYYSSPDGVTWTVRNLSVLTGIGGPERVTTVAFNNNLWVCMGATGTTSRPYTKTGSPISGAWTAQAALTGADNYARMRYTAGTFYVLRQASSGQLYRSPNDGVNFSSVGIMFATNCGADWAYNGSQWIAVGSTGTTPQAKVSSDLAEAWSTVNTSFFPSTVIAAVEWVPGLDLWIIGGTDGLMAYSPDAVNWTLGTVTGLGTRAIQAITYGYI